MESKKISSKSLDIRGKKEAPFIFEIFLNAADFRRPAGKRLLLFFVKDDRDHGSFAYFASYGHFPVASLFDAVFYVIDSEVFVLVEVDGFIIETDAVVRDFHDESVRRFVGFQVHRAAFVPAQNAVFDGVFHDGLDAERWDGKIRRLQVEIDRDPAPKAQFFQRNVGLDMAQFVLEGDRAACRQGRKIMPQIFGEIVERLLRFLGIDWDQRGDRGDRIVDEMRFDLGEHQGDLRLFILFFFFGEVDIFLNVYEEEQDLDRDDDGGVSDGVSFENVLQNNGEEGQDAI